MTAQLLNARHLVWLYGSSDVPCYSRCGTLKNPHCFMAISAEHRSTFATVQRQWRRLCISEKFFRGTKNSNQPTNQPTKQTNKQVLTMYTQKMSSWERRRAKEGRGGRISWLLIMFMNQDSGLYTYISFLYIFRNRLTNVFKSIWLIIVCISICKSFSECMDIYYIKSS